MSKVTINIQAKIDEADYNKILAFAEANEQAAPWLKMDERIKELVELSLKNLVAQITQIEANVNIDAPERPKVWIPE